MAELVVQFAISYIMTRLSQQDGPRLSNLKGFSSDYGGAIPLIYGPENRAADGTVIWATEIKETTHKHKPATDYLFGLVGALLPAQKSYSYSIDFAVLICGNPISRVTRAWANKKVIFEADATSSTPPTTVSFGGLIRTLIYSIVNRTHQVFGSMRVYTGTDDQDPDPTIEADKGVGNVPAYLNTAYVVFDEFQLEDFGNAVPYQVEFEVEEAETGALRRIVMDMAAASGIDTNSISTSGLDGEVRGLILSDNTSVAESFGPLATAYAFDVADITGSLRFVPRGKYPRTTVSSDQLAGHDADEDRPEPLWFVSSQEIGLPNEVTVTYSDPARDYQPNSQVTRRAGGSSQANITVSTSLVLTADEAQGVADRVMWEAWSARQTIDTATDDRRADLQATEVHAFTTPTGLDTYRITRRTRGLNGVIELQLVADRPLLYDSDLPGVAAPVAPTPVEQLQPINTPIFIEPPSTLTGGAAVLMVAVSGGSGVLASGGSTYTVDPSWPGVAVWVATEDVDASYRTAGAVDGPSYMGVLTRPLDQTSGASPDVVNVLGVDLTMSGGQLESVSAADAATGAINLAWVESPGGGGEFVTFQNQTSSQPYVYECTTLYRGLHGSAEVNHDEGADFAMIDDAIYRYSLPPDQVGQTLYFKFVQPNETLADVDTYVYSPTGSGFGTGTGGVPSALTVTVTAGNNQAVVAWTAPPTADNVRDYTVYRAPGLGASFGSALEVAVVNALTWTDTDLDAEAEYTYFVVANNVVGASTPASDDTTTPAAAALDYGFAFGPKTISAITLSEAFAFFDTPLAWTMPAGIAGSQGTIGGTGATAPSAETDFDVQVGGVSVGTMRFAASSLTATFIKASSTDVAEGAVTSIVAPANLNGMAGQLFGSILGSR